LGAHLPNLFKPGEVVSYCQKIGGISDHDAYRAWNMGQGMALISPEPDKILREAKKKGIEARVAGEITAKPGIRLTSRGSERPGAELSF
jgi:phosphoribosylaminoimidazole (AIR) synthetase